MLVCGIDPGVRDLGICLLRYNKEATPAYVVLDWQVVNLSDHLNKDVSRPGSSGWSVAVEDAVSAAVNVVRHLVSGIADRECRFVIERQFNNVRLVALSHALQAALESMGFARVMFVHSMSRFNVVGHRGWQDDPLATQGNVKKRSVYLARKLLDDDPKRQEQLDKAGSARRDDFSDAFLFALSCAYDHQTTKQ